MEALDFFQSFLYAQATAKGHVDVEDDQVGIYFNGLRDGLKGIFGCGDVEIISEEFLQGGEQDFVIVHN